MIAIYSYSHNLSKMWLCRKEISFIYDNMTTCMSLSHCCYFLFFYKGGYSIKAVILTMVHVVLDT